MTVVAPDPGSFRDPSGRIFYKGDKVLRTVTAFAAAEFAAVRDCALLDELAARGLVLPARPAPELLGEPFAAGAVHVLEHPRLPFVSYPYEWCFSALKAAALCHLDVHLAALERGITLADASASNIQFRGARPVFIDALSFRRYREGELWAGHRQFCEQFLNPLLLRAYAGVPFQAWYRGAPEGLPVEATRRLLPWRRKLSWRALIHVVLQARFQERAAAKGVANRAGRLRSATLSPAAFRGLLVGLRRWIASLDIGRNRRRSPWSAYTPTTSYRESEAEAKGAFVRRFAQERRPKMLWDVGCNTGEFAEIAARAGAGHVVGFDSDEDAVERAFARARERDLPFLPLCMDLANPSPDQGWGEDERRGLKARAPADAVLALALVHHLAIGRNIPLDRLVAWLLDLAPSGIVEFVPKDDPMVRRLLALREDIFPGYTEPAFKEILGRRARILRAETVSGTGRTLIAYACA